MASSKKDAKTAKSATKTSSPRPQGSPPKTAASTGSSAGSSAKTDAKASTSPVKAASKASVSAVKASASVAKAEAAPIKAKTTDSAPPKSLAVKSRPESVKAAAASSSSAKPAAQAVEAKTAVAASSTKSVKSVAADKPVATPADIQAKGGKKAAAAVNPTHVKAAAPASPVASKPTENASVGAGKGEPATRPASPTIAKSPEKSAPAKSPEPVAVATSPAVVKAAADAKMVAPAVAKPRPVATKLGFKLNEYIVYPAHGVGQIISVETQEVAGFSLELYVVSFIKDKMILKVPTSKVATVGMRKLAETNIVEKALSTLSGRARIKRTMWSRRAQEYEAKINSGDLVTIAEVVRDLYRSDTQPEQSYSERQLYEAALDRMAREIAAVRRLIDSEALKLIEAFLQKGPKRGAKSDAEGDGDGDIEAEIDDTTDVDAAA